MCSMVAMSGKTTSKPCKLQYMETSTREVYIRGIDNQERYIESSFQATSLGVTKFNSMHDSSTLPELHTLFVSCLLA